MRFAVFRHEDYWFARCLEYDMGVQAPDAGTLRDNIAVLVATRHAADAGVAPAAPPPPGAPARPVEDSFDRTGTPFGGKRKAPEVYFEIWKAGERRRGFMDGRPPPPVREDLAPFLRDHPIEVSVQERSGGLYRRGAPGAAAVAVRGGGLY